MLIPELMTMDEIIYKILQFHGSLAALESVMCSTCLEQFPSININVAGLYAIAAI